MSFTEALEIPDPLRRMEDEIALRGAGDLAPAVGAPSVTSSVNSHGPQLGASNEVTPQVQVDGGIPKYTRDITKEGGAPRIDDSSTDVHSSTVWDKYMSGELVS